MKKMKKMKFIEIKGTEELKTISENSIMEFHREVEDLVNSNNITYLEAVEHQCEFHNIEVETIADLISPVLKRKIEHEAIKLHLVHGEIPNSLPLGE